MSRFTWVKLIVFVAVLAGLGWLVRLFGFDLRQMTPEHVRTFVLGFGVWAPIVYLVAYGQPVVPLPASIMTATAGLAFGPLWGTLAALGGATLRACGQFGMARLLGRDAVETLLKGRLAKFNERIEAQGFKTVCLIRLIPNLPFDVQNYGLGFSPVRFGPYALGSVLGMAPGAFAYVYFGYSLSDPKQVWKLALAVLLVVGLIVATSVWKRRHPKSAGADDT